MKLNTVYIQISVVVELTLYRGFMETRMTSELKDFCFFTNSLNESTFADISFGNLFCFGGSPEIMYSFKYYVLFKAT